MGLNISGIIVDKNFSNRMKEFESCFKWRLINPIESIFDYALENKFNKKYVDFYFTSNGTLALLWEAYYSYYSLCELSKRGQVIKFDLSETRMFFSFNFYENDHMTGEHYFELDKDRNWIDKGTKPFLNVSNGDDLIFKTLSSILKQKLGKSLQEIDLSEKVQRFEITFK